MITRGENLVGHVFENTSDQFLEALRQDISWDDAVSVQRADESNQPDVDIATRHSFIYRRLGHLTVNPNKLGANEALVKSYVFSPDPRPGIVNSNDKSVADFIGRLIRIAKEERAFDSQLHVPDPAAASGQATRMFVLHGPRGTGKTFFLNYLLSRYSELLDKEKVIWVRINLVTNFAPNNKLENWIPAQASKILLRYYDINQKSRSQGSQPPIPLDFIEHIKAYIEEEYADYPDRLRELRDHIIIMKESFRDLKYDKPVSEDMVPSVLGKEIMRYAREMGYSFIVTLDGLDRLDITNSAKAKFDSLCRQVDLIGRAYERQGFTLLVVSRTTLLNTNSCFSDPYRQGSTRCLPMGKVDLLAIANRRLEMLMEEIPRKAPEYGWDILDWPEHIKEFKRRLFDDQDGFFGGLLDTLGDDRRAQMQIIQLDYLDFLVTKRARAYQLIEYLTKAGKRYPPRYYFYAKYEDGDLIHAGNAEPTPLDSKFFPTIFSFPILQEGQSDYLSHPHSMLVGLRIAQLVLSCSELIKNKENLVRDSMLGRELSLICKQMFGYEEQLVYALLEELAEFDMVQLDGGLYPLPIRREEYVIRARPKLRMLLDTMIYDIAYLNLAAMRVPVAVGVLSSDNNTFGLFKAETLDQKLSSLDRESTMSGWIFAKTVNAISLYRLVKYINDLQKSNAKVNYRELNSRQKIIFDNALNGIGSKGIGMFNVPREMERNIRKQIGGIFTTYEKDRSADALGKLLKRMSNHFTKWDGVSYEY